MTNVTKNAFAKALKQLIQNKPLEKITIADLSSACDVNRQTFYYHFRDIYDLVEWIYVNEAGQALGENKKYANWSEGFLDILNYLKENETFVRATCTGQGRDYLFRFLFSKTKLLLRDVVDECAEGVRLKEADREFIADFYKYAFVGIVGEWVSEGMKESPSAMTNKLEKMIAGNIKNAVKRLSSYIRE